jgi:hypothetical protein
MPGTKLTPEKITSPIQLMAAWFSMLVLIVSVLLTAAANIVRPAWAAGYLVIFASAVVILVITCVTLMLTKFRPHLQEGKEYAEWLKDKDMYSAGLIVKSVPRRRARIQAEGPKRLPSIRIETFLIGVSNSPGGVELVETLKNAGFNAEIYRPPGQHEVLDNPKEHEAIWVGSQIDASRAIQAIKLATSVWPYLKYVHISGDENADVPDYVHDQIFFGGATSTAKNYNLQGWTGQDFLQLDEAMTTGAFHSLIRSKYSHADRLSGSSAEA